MVENVIPTVVAVTKVSYGAQESVAAKKNSVKNGKDLHEESLNSDDDSEED